MDFQQKLDAFRKVIGSKKTHTDFARVVELSKEYLAHITGVGLDDYLKQFNQREDKAMFEQRKRLTNSISKPTANSIKKPFYKVSRNKNVKTEINIEDKTRLEAVQKMISNFYGSNALNNKGLDFWLKNRFLELSFIDPNAWVVLEWEAKPLNEVVEPFPFEVKSTEAVNFTMKNGVLQNLTIKIQEMQKFFNEKDEEIEKAVDSWTFYEVGSSLKVTQYDPRIYERDGVVIDFERQMIWQDDAKNNFIATYNSSNLDFIPAFRVGYLRDDVTDGRTFVSPIDPSIPYFRKALKAVSELDLSITLHTFPQKIQFVSACKNRKGGDRCKDGVMSQSKQTCTSCKGTGFEVHKSGQDAIFHKMPEDKSELFDLDKTLIYKTPPIELIKFQDEYVRSLKQDAHLSIFNSTMFLATDPQFAKTATEVDLNFEGVHDTIFPYTEKFSEIWKTVVLTFVRLSGFTQDVEIKHVFPSDLKLKTTAMLVSELKTATDSNAPSFLIDQISSDIARQIYNGDELSLKRYETRHKFFPFNGKSKEEIGLLLASPFVSTFTKVLNANFEAIFTDIEKENPKFYFMPYVKQWDIVEKTVKVFTDEIKKENEPEPFKFDFTPSDENPTVGNESEGGEENPKVEENEV